MFIIITVYIMQKIWHTCVIEESSCFQFYMEWTQLYRDTESLYSLISKIRHNTKHTYKNQSILNNTKDFKRLIFTLWWGSESPDLSSFSSAPLSPSPFPWISLPPPDLQSLLEPSASFAWHSSLAPACIHNTTHKWNEGYLYLLTFVHL